MAAKLDMDKIAAGLGAKRKGKIRTPGGYFGALQVASEVSRRMRTPKGGGRPTDPAWTERRLVALAPETLQRLRKLACRVKDKQDLALGPMQVAAILLEKAVEDACREDDEELKTGT